MPAGRSANGQCEQRHRGCVSELLAAAWLLEQGYSVYRNVSAHGEADLVAIRRGEILLVDVKTVRPPRGGYRVATASGVKTLCVDHSGQCYWTNR
jgi:Holliday junction resolvase-like predicted endonuclease